MKLPKIHTSDAPNWIMAIMSISALLVSIIALVQTSTSNHLAQLMYEKSEKPLFRVKTEYPDGFLPTNKYEKLLVRNITVSNEGAPVSELNSVEHIPLLHLAVFDRDKPELAPHLTNKIIIRSVYEDGLCFYNSKGVFFSAEGAKKQKAIAKTVQEYANAHPERFCVAQLFDLFKIEYTDTLGLRREHYMLEGCQSTAANFSRLQKEAKAFEKKVRAISEDFTATLDYCYEFSKSENQSTDKLK